MSHRLSIRAWSLLALTAPLLLAWSAPAPAADLGGECCADLEERIAELEATTVRSGNRAVTLNISGQINQAILMWDDGEDRDRESRQSARSRDTHAPIVSPRMHRHNDCVVANRSLPFNTSAEVARVR